MLLWNRHVDQSTCFFAGDNRHGGVAGIQAGDVLIRSQVRCLRYLVQLPTLLTDNRLSDVVPRSEYSREELACATAEAISSSTTTMSFKLRSFTVTVM